MCHGGAKKAGSPHNNLSLVVRGGSCGWSCERKNKYWWCVLGKKRGGRGDYCVEPITTQCVVCDLVAVVVMGGVWWRKIKIWDYWWVWRRGGQLRGGKKMRILMIKPKQRFLLDVLLLCSVVLFYIFFCIRTLPRTAQWINKLMWWWMNTFVFVLFLLFCLFFCCFSFFLRLFVVVLLLYVVCWFVYTAVPSIASKKWRNGIWPSLLSSLSSILCFSYNALIFFSSCGSTTSSGSYSSRGR